MYIFYFQSTEPSAPSVPNAPDRSPLRIGYGKLVTWCSTWHAFLAIPADVSFPQESSLPWSTIKLCARSTTWTTPTIQIPAMVGRPFYSLRLTILIINQLILIILASRTQMVAARMDLIKTNRSGCERRSPKTNSTFCRQTSKSIAIQTGRTSKG